MSLSLQGLPNTATSAFYILMTLTHFLPFILESPFESLNLHLKFLLHVPFAYNVS